MVGSLQWGLVGTREEEASSFKAIYRSHKSTEAVGRTKSSSSVESITRSPSLLQSTLQPTVSAEADYSQRIDQQCLQLHPVDQSIESLDLTPTIDTDLQPALRLIFSLYYVTVCYITLNLSSL